MRQFETSHTRKQLNLPPNSKDSRGSSLTRGVPPPDYPSLYHESPHIHRQFGEDRAGGGGGGGDCPEYSDHCDLSVQRNVRNVVECKQPQIVPNVDKLATCSLVRGCGDWFAGENWTVHVLLNTLHFFSAGNEIRSLNFTFYIRGCLYGLMRWGLDLEVLHER